MVAPLREQLQEYHYLTIPELNTGGNYYCSYYSRQELNTGGNYYCSYYSRQGDRWQSEKGKLKTELCVLVDYTY